MRDSAKRSFSRCDLRAFVAGLLLATSLLGSSLVSSSVTAQDNVKGDAWNGSLPRLLQGPFGNRHDSRRDSREVLDLIRPMAQPLSDSVVTVFVDGKVTSLGTIVSADGGAVTKASELGHGKVRVRLNDHRLLDAHVAAVRRTDDLALLRFDARGLKPVQFAPKDPAVGSFVISAGVDGEVVGLGIVGNESRMISERGVLGVGYQPLEKGVRVSSVFPGSGAASAGIQNGDIIQSVNGKDIVSGELLKSEIETMFPGERAKLVVERDGEVKELEVEVRDASVIHETESDSRVHGARSGRLAGFGRVLQHDTVLEPAECGGPIFDLSGNVVGINIARAGRVASYALPTQFLAPVVQSLLASETK